MEDEQEETRNKKGIPKLINISNLNMRIKFRIIEKDKTSEILNISG